ncbi:hypothetical protein WEH80_21335 [Actinomycetes bacterium KLBMP 9759]
MFRTNTATDAVRRGTVVAAIALTACLGAAFAGDAAFADMGAIVPVSTSTVLHPEGDKHGDQHGNKPGDVDVQKVIDAGIVAQQERAKANAAATAVGTARGVLDDRRAALAIADRDAEAAQEAVNTQQAAVDRANKAFLDAGEVRKQAAAATNAAPNDPVKEAEYNIRHQDFLNRLRDLAEAGRQLDALKKTRDGANAVVATKTTEVRQGEADVVAAQDAATAADNAAKKAEGEYARLSKAYESSKKNRR